MEQIKIQANDSKLMSLLGKNLYTDKLSFLCEVMQNATDSHIKAGIPDKKIDVSIYSDQIIIRDYGVSFSSKEDFKNLIGTILASDKEQVKTNSSSQTGGMGIGSIAWCAYYDQCCYTVYKDGMQFTATLTYIENEGIKIAYSGYSVTEELDGVMFRIRNLTHIRLIYQKLKCFTNICYTEDISKHLNYKVVKTENLMISNLIEHLCIEYNGYCYPVPIEYCEINRTSIPFAIRYNIGELTPSPTRETLLVRDITKEKELFNKKLVKCLEEILEQDAANLKSYIKDIKNASVEEYYKYYILHNQHNNLQINNVIFNTQKLKSIYNELLGANCKSYLLNSSVSLFGVDNNDVKKSKELFEHTITCLKRNLVDIFISRHGKTSRRTAMSYNICKSRVTNIVLENKKLSNQLKDSLIDFAAKNNKDVFIYYYTPIVSIFKETPEKEAEKIKEIHDWLFNNFITPLKDIPLLPKPVSAPRKKVVKLENVKENDTVIEAYSARPSQIGNTIVFDVYNKYTKKELEKLPYRMVYGTKDNLVKLKQISQTFKKNIKVVMITTKQEEKYLNELNSDKFINVTDMKDKINLFTKHITAYQIQYNLFSKYNIKESHIRFINENVNASLAESLTKLQTYVKDYTNYRLDSSEEFIKECIELANTLNIKDELIWEDYINCEHTYSKLDFLPVLFNDYFNKGGKDAEIMKGVIQDLIKYRKIRLDYKHYNNSIITC